MINLKNVFRHNFPHLCDKFKFWKRFYPSLVTKFKLGCGLSKLGSKIQTWIKSIRKIGKYLNQKIHVVCAHARRVTREC